MKKLHLDFVQLFSGVIGMIVFGVVGLLAGIMLGVDTRLVIGQLPGYEAGGALGGAIGLWLGSVAGIYLANRFSHTTGKWWLSLILSFLGAATILFGVTEAPGLNAAVLFFGVPILAYVGWNWPHWRACRV